MSRRLWPALVFTNRTEPSNVHLVWACYALKSTQCIHCSNCPDSVLDSALCQMNEIMCT